MKTRLLNIWEYLSTSLWFVPGLMVMAAIGLAALMLNLDNNIAIEDLRFSRYLHFGTPEGTREVLSTIASSMITVAGVVFSITIVALTLASSQYGPHLLRTFIRNTSNQVVLGTFIATYIYCLIILRSVQSGNETEFVPSLSVSVGMALALINVGVLIYFIHHVSTSIQADNVAAEVHAELMQRMRDQYPNAIEDENNNSSLPGDVLATIKSHYPITIDVPASADGYLQAVDCDGLKNFAVEQDCVVELQQRPGKPVEVGCVLCKIHSGKQLDEASLSNIDTHFIIGAQPTPEQDVEFAVRQLVQVAVRALSPGVNDPFTAMTCIDRLGFALCYLCGRAKPKAIEYDQQNNLRLLIQVPDFPGIMDAAFNQIRQSGDKTLCVSIRLLETFTRIAEHCHTPEQREAVRKHGDMVYGAMAEAAANEYDLRDLQERYQVLGKSLPQL